MSLINNMLKDLEMREKGLAINDNTRLFSGKNIIRKLKILLITFCALLLVLFVCSMLANFLQKQPQQNQKIIYKVTEFAQSAPAVVRETPETPLSFNNLASTTTSSFLDPTIIDNVRLEIKNDIAEITLQLNSQALYRMVTRKDSHQIIMTIENTRLNANLPQTKLVDNGIESLEIQSVDDNNSTNTKLLLNLMQGAEIKNINLIEESKAEENKEYGESGMAPNRVKLVISIAYNSPRKILA